MTLLAATNGAGSLAAALALGALGVWWLLPKPRQRSVALGTFASLAGLIVLAIWAMNRFGPVASDSLGSFLFWLFAAAAVGFSGVFITQRNPARGAIAFAFVIVSVCGLFLLLAAPFLMAATIIIYAGAIIVTFLFVLMLSQTRLAAGENDRTREPLLGSLGGFSFLGLVLFALVTNSVSADNALPARPMLPGERAALLDAAAKLTDPPNDREAMLRSVNDIREKIAVAVGGAEAPRGAGNIPDRLATNADAPAKNLRQQATNLRQSAHRTLTSVENRLLKATVTDADVAAAKSEMANLAPEVRLLAAHGELPARNVANLGYTLYSDYILAVELAGAVLLAATIGAVLIAGRRGAAA
jgi:NADH:ubiquinone oxidoreductase subunit 6 (subunit J)